MQFSVATLLTIFAAASALPSDISARQSTFSELAIFTGTSCAERTGTIALVASGNCETIQDGVTSAKVDIDIPAGCTIEFFPDKACSSAQTIVVPRNLPVHQCFAFGPTKQIGSYVARGCEPQA